MPIQQARLTRTILIREGEPRSSIVQGRYNPETDVFVYNELGRGAKEVIVQQASQAGTLDLTPPEIPTFRPGR